MKRSDINSALKEIGYDYVRYSLGGNQSRCYTSWNGKRVRGIRAGSIGGMTVTDAYKERNRSVMNQVVDTLCSIGMVHNGDYMESPDGKIRLSLSLELFPAYASRAGLDPSYRNYYVVPTYC